MGVCVCVCGGGGIEGNLKKTEGGREGEEVKVRRRQGGRGEDKMKEMVQVLTAASVSEVGES